MSAPQPAVTGAQLAVLRAVGCNKVKLDLRTMEAWQFTNTGVDNVSPEINGLTGRREPLVMLPPGTDLTRPYFELPARLPYLLTDAGAEMLSRTRKERRRG